VGHLQLVVWRPVALPPPPLLLHGGKTLAASDSSAGGTDFGGTSR
jgi:hypothetical protein